MEDFLTVCKSKDENAILKMLETIDFDLKDENNATLLHHIIDQELEEVALVLIQKIMDSEKYYLLSFPDQDGNTPLIASCELNLIQVATRLLETKHSNPSYIDESGYSALTLCCLNENLEKVGLQILQEDATSPYIGHPSVDLERTPLMYACFNNLDSLAYNISQCSSANIFYIENHTLKNALMYALEAGLDEVSDYLIEQMDDFTQVDIEGNTALILACGNTMEPQALKILEKGNCLVELLDEGTDTSLIMACANEMEETSLKILEYCKETHEYLFHKDEEGLTAFDYACENNLLKVIEVFIHLLPIEKSIPALTKHRLYSILKKLIDNEKIGEAVKKILFDDLCVSELLEIISKVTSSDSLDNLDKYIKKLEESPIDCLICCKPTVTHYLLTPCKHVLKIDATCLSKVDDCPICRVHIDEKNVVFMV